MDEKTLRDQRMQAMHNWFEGFGNGDLELAYSGFRDDATWLGIGRDFSRVEYSGKQNIIDYQSAWVNGVWGGEMHYTIVASAAEGDVVFAEWTDVATAKDGTPYENRGVHVFEYKGSEVVRARMYVDFGPLRDYIAKFESASSRRE